MIQVGDIVRGKAGNGYKILNEDMKRGVVLYTHDSSMTIKITEHSDTGFLGHTFCANRYKTEFEVIGHVKPFGREKVTEILNTKRFVEIFEYDLRGADLRRVDLCGAIFYKDNLCGADFREADLRGAKFYHVELHDAILEDANLQGANLQGADLARTSLINADLCGANIDHASLPIDCGGLNMHIDDRIGIQLLYHAVSNILFSKNTSKELKKEVAAVIPTANRFHRAEECGFLSWKSTEESAGV